MVISNEDFGYKPNKGTIIVKDKVEACLKGRVHGYHYFIIY